MKGILRWLTEGVVARPIAVVAILLVIGLMAATGILDGDAVAALVRALLGS